MDQETANKFAGYTIRTMEEVVGANLTRYREREGISQAELGRRIGQGFGREWSRQAVSLAESGKRNFGVTDLVMICQGTHLTMADLLTIPEDWDLVDLGGEMPAPGLTLNTDMQLTALTLDKMRELRMEGYYRAVLDLHGHVEKERDKLDKWFKSRPAKTTGAAVGEH